MRVSRRSRYSRNSVRNWITGDYITDTGCSLKLLRRECIDRVKLANGMHRFLPTLLRIEGADHFELVDPALVLTYGVAVEQRLRRVLVRAVAAVDDCGGHQSRELVRHAGVQRLLERSRVGQPAR